MAWQHESIAQSGRWRTKPSYADFGKKEFAVSPLPPCSDVPKARCMRAPYFSACIALADVQRPL